MRVFLLIAIILFGSISVFADDPGLPDSVYIGNLDGSPLVVGTNEIITVPVWVKTDDSVTYVHIPLATNDTFIVERLEGEHALSYCRFEMPPGYPIPEDIFFSEPDTSGDEWTNQGLIAWWDFDEVMDTNYEWCHKFNFFMRTTSNPDVAGDTALCLAEGFDPINGGPLFGLVGGVIGFVPEIVYGSLAFVITEIYEEDKVLNAFSILGAYPNPFNAQTTIEFTLPEESEVELVVYDLLGRKVAALLEGAKPAGVHSIIWDADDMPSGIYFARLEAQDKVKNIKMVLLK